MVDGHRSYNYWLLLSRKCLDCQNNVKNNVPKITNISTL